MTVVDNMIVDFLLFSIIIVQNMLPVVVQLVAFAASVVVKLVAFVASVVDECFHHYTTNFREL
jgi:hypothetical protein